MYLVYRASFDHVYIILMSVHKLRHVFFLAFVVSANTDAREDLELSSQILTNTSSGIRPISSKLKEVARKQRA